jgi:hypothetical protein
MGQNRGMQGWMRALLRRWLLAQPECASASEYQRKDAADFVCREVTPGWVDIVVITVPVVAIIFVLKCVARLLGPHLGFVPVPMRDIVEVLIGLVFMISFVVLVAWLGRHRALTMLRTRLVALGVPLCKHCGYDLRGQTEPRCPECGRPFDVSRLTGARPTDDVGSAARR